MTKKIEKQNILDEFSGFLKKAGIPKNDIPLWTGVVSLDLPAYAALIQFFSISTKAEIVNLNSILKKKVAILKSGNKKAFISLALSEKRRILK